MKAKDFITTLSAHEKFDNCEIHSEKGKRGELKGGASGAEGTPGEGIFPRLLCEYKGHYIKFDFIIDTEFLMEVNTPPPHRLLVCPETMVSKLMDKAGLSAEVKIGDKEFDKKYLIQYAKQAIAEKLLGEEVRKLLTEMEPFIKFEMTNKEYIIIRNLGKIRKDYTPDNAIEDMDKLIKIAELCKYSEI